MINCLSSMATRQVLAELGADFESTSGREVRIESVGGVDAARRVEAGERYDCVFLAADVVDRLIAAGHLLPASRVDIVRSAVAVAVRAGAPHPDIATTAALRAAMAAAPTIGYSTGPSGIHLVQLTERWGITAQLVQAAPGVPVASLVARGDAALGFQQLAELLHAEGVEVVGTLPGDAAFVTTFSAGRATASAEAAEFLAYLTSDAATAAKRRHGMEPCR